MALSFFMTITFFPGLYGVTINYSFVAFPIFLAGFPNHNSPDGTSLVTTLPAPIIAFSPIVIPASNVAFAPIEAPRFTTVLGN